jgi:predicted transcriptional regulator
LPLFEELRVDISDQLVHERYVRQSIEAGLADSKAGKTVDVTAVMEKFGLPRKRSGRKQWYFHQR